MIVIKRSPRARRLALRLDPKDRVFHLVVPPGMPIRKAEEFAELHNDWMQERLNDLAAPVPFTHKKVIPILGRNRTIHIVRKKTLKSTEIILKHNELLVFTNLDDPTKKIIAFLSKLAKEEFQRMCDEKAERINKRVRAIHIRDTRSRWGSCSEDAHLSFSWRLILAPPAAYDYVVAHEVAHLKHLDHRKNFWKVCRQLSDDFIEGSYWMQNHGHELMRFGATVN
jgi:predicted metal-dependent hydrolase